MASTDTPQAVSKKAKPRREQKKKKQKQKQKQQQRRQQQQPVPTQTPARKELVQPALPRTPVPPLNHSTLPNSTKNPPDRNAKLKGTSRVDHNARARKKSRKAARPKKQNSAKLALIPTAFMQLSDDSYRAAILQRQKRTLDPRPSFCVEPIVLSRWLNGSPLHDPPEIFREFDTISNGGAEIRFGVRLSIVNASQGANMDTKSKATNPLPVNPQSCVQYSFTRDDKETLIVSMPPM